MPKKTKTPTPAVKKPDPFREELERLFAAAEKTLEFQRQTFLNRFAKSPTGALAWYSHAVAAAAVERDLFYYALQSLNGGATHAGVMFNLEQATTHRLLTGADSRTTGSLWDLALDAVRREVHTRVARPEYPNVLAKLRGLVPETAPKKFPEAVAHDDGGMRDG